MLSGTACSPTIQKERIDLDPSQLESCPRTVESPGELPDEGAFQVEVDGGLVWVVPIEKAHRREGLLVQGALVFRGAWLRCRSVVIYVETVTSEHP